MTDIILISNARLSFPNIAEPQRRVDPTTGKEKISYNCDLILSPDHPGYAEFMRRYQELAVDKWKEHAQTIMGMIHSDRKSRCYASGSERINRKTLLPYDGYEGHMAVSVGNSRAPQMIQADGSPVDPQNTMAYQALARKLYGGCLVNAAIKPWVQDNTHGRGVRCDLIAIQFSGDGKPFGAGQADASTMFGQVAAPAFAAAPAAPAFAGFAPAFAAAPAAAKMPWEA